MIPTVFVSTNGKMSFDRLHSVLGGIDGGGVLVLDTKGVNVWCAAGKGTVGADELIRQIKWYARPSRESWSQAHQAPP